MCAPAVVLSVAGKICEVWIHLNSETSLMAKSLNPQQTRYIVLEEFLVWQEIESFLEFVNLRKSEFQISQVVPSGSRRDEIDATHRRSQVLLDCAPFRDVIADRIKFYFSHIQEALHHPPLEIRQIEVQITASNDGDFFRMHNDSEDAYLPSREITFVYFLHREPKAFTGGELRLFDWYWKDNRRLPLETFATVVPRQNEIVFFPSSFPHEVCTVHCPSRAFIDGRLTVNGWIHR
jgi:SM-20-related protein